MPSCERCILHTYRCCDKVPDLSWKPLGVFFLPITDYLLQQLFTVFYNYHKPITLCCHGNSFTYTVVSAHVFRNVQSGYLRTFKYNYSPITGIYSLDWMHEWLTILNKILWTIIVYRPIRTCIHHALHACTSSFTQISTDGHFSSNSWYGTTGP